VEQNKCSFFAGIDLTWEANPAMEVQQTRGTRNKMNIELAPQMNNKKKQWPLILLNGGAHRF